MNAIFPASYSKLSTFEKCALQAKFRYIDKLPTPKSVKAQRGTDIHQTIEDYLLGKAETFHESLWRMNDVLRMVRSKSPLVEGKMAFSRGFETMVDWKSGDAWFRMVLDAAYPEGAAVIIPEWKSGKMYDDHTEQRKLYAIGGLAQWPDKESAMVTTYYTDLGRKVTAQVDRGQRILLVGQFTERVERMENEKHFAPRPGNYCRWCGYSRYQGGPCRVG